ncbi:bis-aminopropyl spermidine synthase family protein [Nocardia arthritidis]|uniref:Putative methyltransferase n=1 Tax=Nocardia arthritidis TaxID=228602 RepID=A0A6G9Y7L2_9NOCA|nr:bis-aminopropyl spermidine synthase family protein [Nocardia arthritidis]QIS09043.1 putative methyltransferase [Nocardia arthritidis]
MSDFDHSEPEVPIEQVGAVVAAAGVGGRPLREVVRALAVGEHTLAELVRSLGVPRRSVEEVLSALGEDLSRTGESFRLDASRVDDYAVRFDFAQLERTAQVDPLAARLAAHAETVRLIEELIERAPAARQDIDHVSATAETVVRRALWLESTFDTRGAHVLFVGDHDLTSIATALICRDAQITVVDLDERILEFIAGEAARLGVAARCLFGDFRLGFPTAATGFADLVVTDPPYTPEGVKLFLARGLEGLGDKENSRLLLAYGFSARQPALGLKVQNAIRELHLTVEAMLPRFNRYLGAQAVGSAADWYALRPTSKSWRTLDSAAAANIYTHGPQSLEGASGLPDDIAKYLLAQSDQPILVGDGWSTTHTAEHPKLTLATLLAKGIPPVHGRRGPIDLVADLSKDPGAWLLRVLLAANCRNIVAVVPDTHPDLRGQALKSLISTKFRLRVEHATPRPGFAIVHAESTTPPPPPTQRSPTSSTAPTAKSATPGAKPSSATPPPP